MITTKHLDVYVDGVLTKSHKETTKTTPDSLITKYAKNGVVMIKRRRETKPEAIVKECKGKNCPVVVK